ncbi:MAG: RrF2 family transcriptional regulator [Myxococcota bacterium]
MRATQQLQYAIYGLFDLAYNAGRRPVRIQEISTRQRIPARYLEQIFQKLRRAGLIESKRGPGGGYILARAPDAIHLADVLRAVQGGLVTRSRGDGVPARDNPEFVWALIDRGLEEVLQRLSVAELCREAARRGLERAENEPAMYYI